MPTRRRQVWREGLWTLLCFVLLVAFFLGGGAQAVLDWATPKAVDVVKDAIRTTTTTRPAAELAFGQTFTWPDGLAVVVEPPTEFTLAPYGSPSPHTTYLSFQVRLVNGSTAAIEPKVSVSVRSEHVEAIEVYYGDMKGVPDAPIAPGHETTFKVGYGIRNPADVRLEITPDRTHDACAYR